MPSNDRPLGKAIRTIPLRFSFVPLSQEWYGWAKYTSMPSACLICSNFANSLPLSNVKVFKKPRQRSEKPDYGTRNRIRLLRCGIGEEHESRHALNERDKVASSLQAIDEVALPVANAGAVLNRFRLSLISMRPGILLRPALRYFLTFLSRVLRFFCRFDSNGSAISLLPLRASS